MKKSYKLYLPSGKYKIVDKEDFISIATDKMGYNNVLKQKFFNREITLSIANDIYNYLKINIEIVDAILLDVPEKVDSQLKTIEMLEYDIAKFLFTSKIKDYTLMNSYISNSKNAMLNVLEKNLLYKVAEEETRTLKNFIDKGVYFKDEIYYKDNKIILEVTNSKFIMDADKQNIYKYKSVIINEDEFVFNFKKNELFATRSEALRESRKLIDEHYLLPIKHNQIEKIIVRTDENDTIIVFWPEKNTDTNYILSNDLIGNYDLAGETKTSIAFFDNCKDATFKEITLAKDIISKCLNLNTFNMKKIPK